MEYLIKLSDEAGHKVLLTLDEAAAKRNAIDVVFDVIGSERPEDLVANQTLSASQVDDLKAMQRLVFDRDAQGAFIRDGVAFTANGQEVDPDAPMDRYFQPASREGIDYMRCELVLKAPGAAPAAQASAASSQDEQIRQFARMMFLHQVSVGHSLDVTKDYPDFGEIIQACEKEHLIEIDVPSASYKLTQEGQQLHRGWVDEAQDLIRRFDIYGDVDVDSSGRASFDTGMGRDWRVPMFEHEGVDPFKARFLLGLNDGEWDDLPNWREAALDPAWYQEVFAPIESAPSVEDLGRDRLERVMDQAKAALREQQATW
jgi:hypothetical protein